jgi:hypothetical protein
MAGARHQAGEPIGVRSDSAWNVPEPEIAIVLGEHCEPAGLTIANDVSSRAIEGENPLYIPQAKIFAGACAIGGGTLAQGHAVLARIFGGMLSRRSRVSMCEVATQTCSRRCSPHLGRSASGRLNRKSQTQFYQALSCYD